MHFKSSKEVLRTKLINATYVGGFDLYIDFNQPKEAIKESIKQYVRQQTSDMIISVISTLVDDLYSHEEFEQDIGLSIENTGQR